MSEDVSSPPHVQVQGAPCAAPADGGQPRLGGAGAASGGGGPPAAGAAAAPLHAEAPLCAALAHAQGAHPSLPPQTAAGSGLQQPGVQLQVARLRSQGTHTWPLILE